MHRRSMNETTHSPWWGFGTLLVALLVTVAACGTQTSPGGDDPSVVEVYEDVSFYGACGNEVLHHEDLVLYQLLPEEEIDVTRYGSGMGVHVRAVAPPGPGDDIGTLTLYDDGYARFVSENGEYDIWLTEEERDYNWVC